MWIIVAAGGALAVCIVALCGLCALSGGDKERRQAVLATRVEPQAPTAAVVTEEGQATITPWPTATSLPISDIDPDDLRDQLRDAAEAQKHALYGQLRGKRVRWSGWVEAVSKEGDVRVDMDQHGPPCHSSAGFRIPQADVLKYSKEQFVIFEATIIDISEILNTFHFTMRDAVIVE